MIFVHVPKTSGVSLTASLVAHVLGRNVGEEEPFCTVPLKIQFSLRGQQKHKQARNYVPADITEKLWDSYYKFAFVRNPWDRAVSEFHWRHERPSEKDHPPTNFKDFLDYCEFRIRDSKRRKKDIYWTHAQTQTSYVTGLNGNIILDDVFKFEEMDKSIKTISEKLDVPIALEQHNSSNHDHYRTYYNDETKEMVERLYKEDIAMFGYEF